MPPNHENTKEQKNMLCFLKNLNISVVNIGQSITQCILCFSWNFVFWCFRGKERTLSICLSSKPEMMQREMLIDWILC